MVENNMFFKSQEAAELVARGLLFEGFTVSLTKGVQNRQGGYFVGWER